MIGTGTRISAAAITRSWLGDPDGFLFIHRGIVSVRPVASPGAADAMRKRFGGDAGWADATTRLLKDHGFNVLRARSDAKLLQPARKGMVYTINWSLMSSCGKRRGGTYQKPGRTGYPGGCPFIFDPEFPGFCDDLSNRDANKGIVTSRYEPYRGLLDSMKAVNRRTLRLIRHFDRDP